MTAPIIPPNPGAPAPSAGWAAALPEEIRSNPVVQRHKDIESLAREHIGAQDLIGRKGVILPKSFDDAEDAKRFYKELGVPETPDKYDLSEIEVQEDWNDEVGEKMITTMHSLGLTERQVKGILKEYVGTLDGMLGTARQSAVEANTKATAQLKQEWGASYQEKINRASTLFHNAWGQGSEDLRTIQLADGSVLGDHPVFLKGLSAIADVIGKEHKLLGEKQATRLGKTPDEAKTEWATLQTNKDFMNDLMDKNRIGHEQAIAKRDSLYRGMDPAKAPGE